MILNKLIPSLLLLFGNAVYAADPFLVMDRVLPSPAAGLLPGAGCASVPQPAALLTLAAAVERALCANPATRSAWMSARLRAAELGQAQSAFLPDVTLDAGGSRVGVTTLPNDAWAWHVGMDVQYLLYDFGGREAQLDAASALLSAARASQDGTARDVFLQTVAGYFSVLTAQGAVTAAIQTEAAALEALKAASARVAAGSAIPVDRLQAKTVHAQRQIDRIRAEGLQLRLQGELAALMGDAAHADFTLAANESVFADFPAILEKIDSLIEAAQQRRPELRAAEASLNASRSGLRSVEAAGKPTLSAFFDTRFQDVGLTAGTLSGLGVSLRIPLFTGYRSTYQIRAAEVQVEQAAVTRDQVANQVALEVWRAYHKLKTESEADSRTEELVASAQEAESVALGRYKAGLGNILDVLTAQANLAEARQTRLLSRLGLRVARAEMAHAMGDLTWDWIEQPQGTGG